MRTHRFLWFDLETTGLYPDTCRILEWAAVLAADDADGDMSAVQCFSSVIAIGDDPLPEMDAYVTDMHGRNGLLKECAASDTTLEESEDFLLALMRTLAGSDKPRGIVLAGGSVHFDLGFVRVHMPRFAECLSHRVLDVSTLKACERTWGGGFRDIKGTTHRALDDALASLDEAKALRARRWAE